MALSQQDHDDIEQFEKASSRPRSGGGDTSLSWDTSEAGAYGTLWPVNEDGKALYPLRSVKAEKKVSKEYYDEKEGKMKGGNVYVAVEFECFAGPMAGNRIDCNFMTAGKGINNTVAFASAVGCYDSENKDILFQSVDDFLDREVWATIVTEKTTWKGQPQERSVIRFAGFEAINTYVLPDEEGFGEGEVTVPAAELQPLTQEVEEEAEEEEEVVAAKPAPQKRRATAGAAGATPPWPQR